MSDYKIAVSNLHKNFGSKKVLQGVNIKVKKGESLVILGGSGSGKSVLIKSICNLMESTSGSIKVDGKEMSDASSAEKDHLMSKIGYLFQNGALFDSLPIWHNVAFRLMHSEGMNKKQAHDLAIEKLALVGLEERVADLYPSELSGGMQKRAALARAIAADPEIIFFDEPTTGLDPIMSDVVNDLIVTNSKKLGATTITITHDMESAKKIADKIGEITVAGNGNVIEQLKDIFSVNK